MQLRIGGEFGIEAGAAQGVQGEFSLWQQFVPKVEREIFVHTADSSDETIFECAGSTFSCVLAVKVGGNQLVVDVFVDHKLFQCTGTFIVQALQFGA